MTRTRIAMGLGAVTVLVLAFIGIYQFGKHILAPVAAPSSQAAAPGSGEAHPSFLYGRVTSVTGTVYEGRLRTRDGEEEFWGDLFNGRKPDNQWRAFIPSDHLPKQSGGFLGLGGNDSEAELARPFMARMGDIARIESSGTDVNVTLKSGMTAKLNRLDASDFDDGLQIWDSQRGLVNLDSKLVRTIELLPAPNGGPDPGRLHGTIHTRNGEFTGFIQWNREEALGHETLDGKADDKELSLPFNTIQSIARESDEAARVTLRDGREIILTGTREVSAGNRGIYVDDPRYGRVLISWGAFDRADFSEGGTGPSYEDFPPGGPLQGSVTTREGRRLSGRLVYDVDESEITETLDAPAAGVDYILPFGLIASIVPHGSASKGKDLATVTLHGGHELKLERRGDLGEGNGGMLIFSDDRERSEYVPWGDVQEIEIDRPTSIYPPINTP